MATITFFTDKQPAAKTAEGTNLTRAEAYIDFTRKNCVVSDVVQALNIPAGAIVYSVSVLVNTAQGATLTFEVGDGSDVDGWIDSVNGNSTGMNLSPVTAPYPAAGGKYYASADTIDLVLGHTASAAKLTVTAIYSVVEKTS